MHCSKGQFPFYTIILFYLLLTSCGRKFYIDHQFRQTYTEINEFLHSDTVDIPFYKIHFQDGNVVVLNNLVVNSTQDSIQGQGKLYDFNRSVIQKGLLTFPIDEIVILETNQLKEIRSKDNDRVLGLTVFTGLNLAGNIICLSNPKACFGSCPTFYLDGKEYIHSASAEGFSSSIAPSLEKLDIDPLQYSTAAASFEITMKNEAYETHAVNQLGIHAVPKKRQEHVFQDMQGHYYRCTKVLNLNSASKGKKDIKNQLKSLDDHEYFSTTDSFDLNTKEEIVLTFPQLPKGKKGVVINFRQTLLTTFLLYSGLSYMGNEISDYIAKMETNPGIRKRMGDPFDHLGGIELYWWNETTQSWKFYDNVFETGPIAKNHLLSLLPNAASQQQNLRIKIKLAKGLWRIDHIGVCSIVDQIEPISIQPSTVRVIKGESMDVKKVQKSDNQYFISLPGEVYRFSFKLPPLSSGQDNYELFLLTKGYYLEWIREEWLKEKDIAKLKQILLKKPSAWRTLAEEYKSIESKMENLFWSSKYSKIQ